MGSTSHGGPACSGDPVPQDLRHGVLFLARDPNGCQALGLWTRNHRALCWLHWNFNKEVQSRGNECSRGAWRAQSVENRTLYLRVVSLNPILGTEITKK